jgi:hypothetical protein
VSFADLAHLPPMVYLAAVALVTLGRMACKMHRMTQERRGLQAAVADTTSEDRAGVVSAYAKVLAASRSTRWDIRRSPAHRPEHDDSSVSVGGGPANLAGRGSLLNGRGDGG